MRLVNLQLDLSMIRNCNLLVISGQNHFLYDDQIIQTIILALSRICRHILFFVILYSNESYCDISPTCYNSQINLQPIPSNIEWRHSLEGAGDRFGRKVADKK